MKREMKKLAVMILTAVMMVMGAFPVSAATKYGEDKALRTVSKRYYMEYGHGAAHKHWMIKTNNGVEYLMYDSCMNGMTGSTPTNHSSTLTIDGVRYSLRNYKKPGSWYCSYANVIKKIGNSSTASVYRKEDYSVPTSITVKVGESAALTVREPSGRYANVSFQYDPTYVTASGFSAGSYWGKKASITYTGKKAGSFTSYVTVHGYSEKKSSARELYSYTYTCRVNVVSKTSYTRGSSTSSASNTGSGKKSSTTAGSTKKVPLRSISLNRTSVTMKTGEAVNLSVSYNPSNTTDSKNVAWSTSNSSVASVSGGRVTAKKAGSATITAKVGSRKATCRITVKNETGTYVSTTECYRIINTYRGNVRAQGLKRNAELERLAKIRAKELVTKYSHTRPNGQKGRDIIPLKICGVRNGRMTRGENIAMGQTTCRMVMTEWYNSPGHRANMLNEDYTKVGIAGYKYKGTIYWVQLFAS